MPAMRRFLVARRPGTRGRRGATRRSFTCEPSHGKARRRAPGIAGDGSGADRTDRAARCPGGAGVALRRARDAGNGMAVTAMGGSRGTRAQRGHRRRRHSGPDPRPGARPGERPRARASPSAIPALGAGAARHAGRAYAVAAGGPADVRAPRRSGTRSRAAAAADPRHGGERQPPRRPGPAGLPHLRAGRGGGRRALRPHGRGGAAGRPRCWRRRGGRASCSSPPASSRPRPAAARTASTLGDGRDAARPPSSWRPTARARACARPPGSAGSAGPIRRSGIVATIGARARP